MKWLSYFILAYIALGFQIALRGFIDVKGAAPNFVLMVVVFLALNATRESALVGCFLLGLMQDLLTMHPIGTWAVAYSVVAVFVISTQEVVYPNHPLTHFFLCLVGGIFCGVVLTFHGWLYPLLHGKGSASSGGSIGMFGSAVYTAILAPIVLGVLQRVRGPFAFRRRI